VQGLEEAGSEEVEVRQERHETRDQQRVAGPPASQPHPAPREPQVEHTDSDHVAGHGDPVVLQEAHEMMVDGVQVGDRRAEVVAVVPQQHRPERDQCRARAGDDHAEADEDAPQPARPAARVGRYVPQRRRRR
jgi:hypothetical protein